MDWLDLLAVQGTLKSLLQHHSSKASILRHSAFFTEIKNLDLVQALYIAFKAHPDTKLEWTRGHVGTKGNELADEWANKARAGAKIINGEVIVGGEPVKF